MSLSSLPFVAKASSERYLLPHFLFVQSLEAFVAILLEDRLLYPAQAIRIYLDLTASFLLCPHEHFVSPTCPTRALLKNALIVLFT